MVTARFGGADTFMSIFLPSIVSVQVVPLALSVGLVAGFHPVSTSPILAAARNSVIDFFK